MKKTFCDMCEKEIDNPRLVVVSTRSTKIHFFGRDIDNDERKDYDICETCRRKILVILDKEENSNEKA